jgi:hypothetical protein
MPAIPKLKLEQAMKLLGTLPDQEQATFEAFGKALLQEDWKQCVQHIIDRNETVCRNRRRLSWIDRTDHQIFARIPMNAHALKESSWWKHSYYLDELARLIKACAITGGS